jgi:hypothetical protein
MSTAGWIVLIFIVLLFVSINAWLVALLRGKTNSSSGNMWKNASQRLRNPWETEDREMTKLSELMKQLRNRSDVQPFQDKKTKD